MSAFLAIDAPGLMTTVQDTGRPGYQHAGVPVAGALDQDAFGMVNRIVGNAPGEACLEILFQGPAATVEAESLRLATGGSGARLEIAGQPTKVIGGFESVRLERGQQFRVGALGGGSVAYLAVEGGFAVEPVLGSRSTYMRGGFGGFEGRALKAGDRVPLARDTAEKRGERFLPARTLPMPNRFRVVMGPQEDRFTAAGIDALLKGTYKVTAAADRMGFRLEGPQIEQTSGFDIVSDGIAPGAIQVPGSGQPIVLLADRGTTGGYTKIATVISADLPAFGRLCPGDAVRFEKVSLEQARHAAAAHRNTLQSLADQIAEVPPGGFQLSASIEEGL
ncbi:MAG: biotin-dependent carboxyltransferase family protein, partial [Hyphomicrobiales bacterium]